MKRKEKNKILKEYLKRQKDSGFDQLKKIMNQVWLKRQNSLFSQSLNKEISFKEQNFNDWFENMNKEVNNKKTTSLKENTKKIIKKILK